MGLSYTGAICLLMPSVSGNSRDPVPPARMIPFLQMLIDGSKPVKFAKVRGAQCDRIVSDQCRPFKLRLLSGPGLNEI